MRTSRPATVREVDCFVVETRESVITSCTQARLRLRASFIQQRSEIVRLVLHDLHQRWPAAETPARHCVVIRRTRIRIHLCARFSRRLSKIGVCLMGFRVYVVASYCGRWLVHYCRAHWFKGLIASLIN